MAYQKLNELCKSYMDAEHRLKLLTAYANCTLSDSLNTVQVNLWGSATEGGAIMQYEITQWLRTNGRMEAIVAEIVANQEAACEDIRRKLLEHTALPPAVLREQ